MGGGIFCGIISDVDGVGFGREDVFGIMFRMG